MYQQPGQAAIPGMVAQPPPPQNVAQAAAPGAVPGAVPGAQPQPQAGVHGQQPPNRLSFFNKAPVDPAERFRGEGQKFRAKLIGIDQVPNSRGDKMCQEVILKQKSIVTASGLHKQRLIVQVTLEGITVIDADSNQTQFIHPVEKISFISRDTTDRRAFGYIVEGEEKQFHFFGIKTGNAAEGLVLALRDLFQVVYDIKQKEKAAGGATSQAASANLQNLEQGISELTVVANNASGAPTFHYSTSDLASIASDISYTGSTMSLRRKSKFNKLKSRVTGSFNSKLKKLMPSSENISQKDVERLSPLFFDGISKDVLELESCDETDEDICNRLAQEFNAEHVRSGNVQERPVDVELTTSKLTKPPRRKSRSPSKRNKFPSITSMTGSDLSDESDDEQNQRGSLRISMSSDSSDEHSFGFTADRKSVKSIRSNKTNRNAKTPTRDENTSTPTGSSFQRQSTYASAKSTFSASSGMSGNSEQSTMSDGSFTRLRGSSGRRRTDSMSRKRLGHVFKEEDEAVDPWAQTKLQASVDKEESEAVENIESFPVDWTSFASSTIRESPDQDINSSFDTLRADDSPALTIDLDSTDVPDSLFGSVSSTPTDVTSMWGDFPQDAQEAFADAQEDVDRNNYFLDRIIEETMVKVTHEVTENGIQHTYQHQATWQNVLPLPINHCDASGGSESGSSSRSSSRSDWSSNSSNKTSTSSSRSSDSISSPRGLPPENNRPQSSLNKSRPPSRSMDSKEESSASINGIPLSSSHCRDNSNISSMSGKSSIQSEIDRISQTDRESLICEQIKEHKNLPPIPSTPILDRLNISSSLRSGDSFRSQLVRRNCPPPIPPRLSDRRKKAQPDTPTEAAPSGNGLDDLAGAFDTAAPSPAAVSTENKMASIMGAFGSAPAAQPNPAMGGMGMPAQQNAFGGMGGMQGMGGMPQQTMAQPAMSMPSMSQPAMSMPAMSQPAMAQPAYSMPSMSQPAMSMPAMSQPAMSAPAMSTQSFGASSMGMMGAASMTPAASQQPAMTPSGGTNMGKAMNDPFADLGGLTGLKPKSAPVAQAYKYRPKQN